MYFYSFTPLTVAYVNAIIKSQLTLFRLDNLVVAALKTCLILCILDTRTKASLDL